MRNHDLAEMKRYIHAIALCIQQDDAYMAAGLSALLKDHTENGTPLKAVSQAIVELDEYEEVK